MIFKKTIAVEFPHAYAYIFKKSVKCGGPEPMPSQPPAPKSGTSMHCGHTSPYPKEEGDCDGC